MTDEVEVIDVEPTEEEVEAAQNLPAVRAAGAMVARDEITADDVIAQREKITQVMDAVMRPEVHYGKVPGVSKPTLLKPGAELLAVTFRLAPTYKSERIFHDDGHLTVVSACFLTHIPTGLMVAAGEGLCSSKEKKYAKRKGERVCPECGEPQVRLGKPRNGRPGNWYCWAKQGGCGATWALDSEQAGLFEAMEVGEVDNPDIADTWNTVLKMSNKRALVAAILNGTGASDVFTQDVEDMPAGQKRDIDDRGGSGAAHNAKTRKVRDIEALFAAADKKRGLDAGTTINEARSAGMKPLVEMTEEELDTVGPKIGLYATTLEPDVMNARGFAPYLEDVPF
jgi:hypothetical protein